MDTTQKDQPAITEWSVLFNPLHVKDNGSHINLSADDESLKNLARRFDVLKIDNVSAKLVLNKMRGGSVIHVTGELSASVTQECVISAEDVITELTDEIESWFANPDDIISLQKARRTKAIADGQELPILEEEDDPDPFINDHIDLGELVAQYISLIIPAYPRAEGKNFDGHSTSASAEHERAFENPFAKLKDWKSTK